MDPFNGVLIRIRRRLALIQWISFQVTYLLYAAAAACLWLILARIAPFLGDPVPVAGGFIAASVAAAAVAAWIRRPTLLAAALAADERLGLDERLTSSLQLAGAEGPMVDAVHADARRCLTHIRVNRDFPIAGPPNLRWLAVPVVAFGIGYVLLPELDLFGYRERQALALAEEKERLEKAEIIKEAIEPLQRIENAKPIDGLVAEVMGELDKISDGLAKGEISERQAMARVLSRAEQIAAEQEKLAASMKTALDAAPESFGEAAEMAEALADGDMEKAAKAAEELMEKLKSDSLSPEQKQELAKSLEKLAQNVQSGNPALAEALANLAASAQMTPGENGMTAEQMAKAMEQLQLSVDDLKSIAEQMKQMEMAGQCLNGACQGMGLKPGGGQPGLGGNWQSGEGQMANGGMGKKGRGRGGQIGDLPDTQTGLTPDMLPGDMNNGPVLATVSQLMPPDESGESTVTYLEGAIVQGQAEAERALSQEEIPAGAKEFVRQYFGTMNESGGTEQGTVQ